MIKQAASLKIPRGQTEKMRAYQRAYKASHPPRDRSAYRAAYRAAHKKEDAAYRAANRERLNANKIAWYWANRTRVLARVKEYSKKNRGQILDYQAKYYLANTDKVKANVREYKKANPEKKAHLDNKRRARKHGNGGSHTLAERQEKFARLGNVCYYCGKAGKLTVDHALPLSRGGTDNIENVLPSCRPCNSKKNKQTVQEYLDRSQRLAV